MSLRGALAAAVIGAFTVGLATAGVAFIIPALVYRQWRRRKVDAHWEPY